MEKSKNQILSELYCIKSGLSAISIEKDKICKVEKEINKLTEEITTNNDNILNLDNMIIGDKEKIETYKGNSYSDSKKINSIKILKQGFFFAFMGALFSPIILIVGSFVYGLVASIIGADTSPSFAFMHNGILFLYALVLCAIISCIIGIIISLLSEIKRYKNDEAAKKALILSNNESISQHESLLEKHITEFNSNNQILEKNVKSYKDNLVVYNQVKSISTSIAKQLYNALVSQFNSMLDFRDWKHIDLIIFYLETGRADTLKECLQQVDRQVQTDAIIKEIRKASNNICSTIKTSISNLKQEMVVCFDKLSIQLSAQHKEAMNKLSKIDDNITKLNKGIDDLAASIKDSNSIMEGLSKNMAMISNATYLQNALLEKINVNSMSLDKDVHYIIDYKVPKTITNFSLPKFNYKELPNESFINEINVN